MALPKLAYNSSLMIKWGSIPLMAATGFFAGRLVMRGPEASQTALGGARASSPPQQMVSRVALKAKPVLPAGSELPARPEKLLQHADDLLQAGNAAEALRLYKELGPQPADPVRLRVAVAAEMIGDFDRALAQYRVLAGNSMSPRLADAARIGQARIWFRLNRLAEAESLLCDLVLHAEDSSAAVAGTLGDAMNLLALLWGKQTALNGSSREPAATDVADAEPQWSPARLLDRLGRPQETKQGPAPSPSPSLAVVQRFGPAPQEIRMDVHLARMPVTEIIVLVAQRANLKLDWSESAREAANSRSSTVSVRDMSAAALLDVLLAPLGLTWEAESIQGPESGVQSPEPKSNSQGPSDRTAHHSGSGRSTHNSQLLIRAIQEQRSDERQAILQARAERALHFAMMRFPDHPLSASAYLELGNLWFRRGDWSHAITHYQQLLSRFPDSRLIPVAAFNQAQAHLQIGERTTALQTFYKVVDVGRGHALEPIAYWHLGCLLLEDGESRQGVRSLRRAVALARDSDHLPMAALSLAAAHLIDGSPNAANRVLMQHRSILNKAPLRDEVAFLAALAGFQATTDDNQKLRRGRELIPALTHARPERFRGLHGYLLMGEAYSELGLSDQAVSLYERALQSNIDSAIHREIAYRLASLYDENGRHKHAVAMFESLAQSGSSKQAVRARWKLAKIAFGRNDDQHCLEICHHLLQTADDLVEKPNVLRLMGHVYERRGEHEKAALCYAGTIPVGPLSRSNEEKP